jgi:hypothetical protein
MLLALRYSVRVEPLAEGKAARTPRVRPAWARCDGVEVLCGSTDVTS